ncbi:hypothetical protein ACMCNP_06100 [Candidatus Acidulodesulfobacterium sp. H_13]|uniref:hypothetical protein n=1 Tax=Candidatus Acidulodesulfobacterium sp. H_13 TaxID=3395470 RepID=UPI003AF8E46E
MNLGVIDIVNLFINRLALGFMAIAFISQYIGIFKREDRYFRLAKSLILISLIIGTIQTIVYFYFLSILKSGIPNFWIFINKIQPGVIGYSMDTLLIFLILGAIYYYGFKGKDSEHQGWNLFIGILAFLAGFTSDIFYSISQSYTIGPDPSNPIRTPMVLLLIIEKNIEIFALAGALLALWAGVKYIFSSDQVNKKYYDWLGSFSGIITLMFLVTYPVVYFGWLKHFRATSSVGFNRIMLVGQYQWIMYVFTETLGGALVLYYVYMLWKLINGRDKKRPTVSIGLIIFLTIVGIVSLIFGILPPSVGELGNMQPVKYLALTGLFLTSFLVLGYYLKDLTPNFKFGSVSKFSQIFLIVAGLLVAINVPVMGYMKIAARGNNRIIYQTMNLNGTKYVPPVIYPWPVKKGYALLQDKCIICHSLNRVEKYKGVTYGDWNRLVLHQMKDVNGGPITTAEGKEIANYLKSLNIIAYNRHLTKEHKKWTPPASLPWGKSVKK